MPIRWFDKYYILCILLIAVCSSAYSRPTVGNTTTHFIAFSLAGGEANNLCYSSAINSRLGGAANASIHYELHHKGLIFALGMKAQWQMTNDALSEYTDAFERTDRNGSNVQYEYVYPNWADRCMDVRFTLPLQLGYESGEYFYGLLGAQLSLPIMTKRSTSATMFTQGVYSWSIEPVRTSEGNDFTAFGYYPATEYRQESNYKELMWASVSIELGSYIPVSSKRIRLRAGIYADYAFRLGSHNAVPLINYDNVDINPATQNMDNLKANMQMNALVNSDLLKGAAHNLEVGIRLTALINVTSRRTRCMCLDL